MSEALDPPIRLKMIVGNLEFEIECQQDQLEEAVKRIVNLLEHCRIGKTIVRDTIRIQNCYESFFTTKWYKPRFEEPCCFYTTGLLNGFFSAIKNQHVKETRCIAMGDPYCEWEFR